MGGIANVTGGLINNGQWRRFALVRNAGNTIELYLDGVSQGQGSGAEAGGAITTDLRAVGSERRWVQDGYGTTDQDYLNGSVDDLRVYGRALSAAEIAALTNEVAAIADVNGNGMPDSWENYYFGGTNVVDGGAGDDWDHDGMSNLGEYKAGTNPTNDISRFQVSGFSVQGGGATWTNLVLSWMSVAGRCYAVQEATNLLDGFTTIAATGIVGTGIGNSWTAQVDQAGEGYFRIAME